MLRKENNLQPNQSQWSLDSCDFTSRFVSSQKKKFHKVAFQKSQLEHPSGAHVARKGQAYSVGGIQKETCSLTDTHAFVYLGTHTPWLTWSNWKQNWLDILYSFSQLAAQQYYQVFYMAFQYLDATLIHCTLNTRKVSIINYKFVSLKDVSPRRCMCVCTIHTYYDYQSKNCTDVALRHCFVICDREKKS